MIVRSIAVAALVFSSPAVLAVDEHHPDDAKKAVAPGKPAVKPPVAPPAGDQAGMQQRMQKMQAQMDRIQKTTDPKERQKLLDEHYRTMMENMQAMRGMGGPMMMGMHGDAKGMSMKGGDPAARSAQMEQRMDMMQMMMEHMMQREQMQMRAPGK